MRQRFFSGFSFDYFMLVHHLQPKRVDLNAELVGLIIAGLIAVPSRYLHGTYLTRTSSAYGPHGPMPGRAPGITLGPGRGGEGLAAQNDNLCLLPKTSCQQPNPSPEEAVRAYRVSPVGTEHC